MYSLVSRLIPASPCVLAPIRRSPSCHSLLLQVNVMSTTTPQLPVLSYAEALNSPSTFIPALRETLLTSGFFYLADIQEAFPTWHADLSAAFEVSRRFFETVSSEEKEGIAMRESKHFRGYSGVGSERTKGIVDLREQIDLG